MLWDAGIEYPTSTTAQIKPQDVAAAELACGLASPKQKTQVEYWLQLLDLDRATFQERAAEHGINIGPNARRLPKGALGKLEKGALTPRDRSALAVSLPPAKPTQPAPVRQRFTWQDVGHPRDMLQFLTFEDIRGIHFAIAEDFQHTADPISPAGVRSDDLLESAASRPQTGMGESRKYLTIELAAAALMHSIIHNHPFHNGNKRTALVSMLAFLDRNGITLTCDENELFKWTIRVAGHRLNKDELLGDRNDIEVVEMARWICSQSRWIDRGERVVTWNVLRRRLAAFDCQVQGGGNRGGRMIISREITEVRNGFFGSRERRVERKYALPYGGDGRQIARNRLKELRRELHLSEEFGIDSATFYGNGDPIDSFISQYRKTLSRLAKV
ncbi:type II toxin-antitoxin system death-on-curing family toxin [Planctomonas deserti]|uniref:type II toxin-antitoxin system death-on-curing family toxin n=1 Tax=Planctomonas deserti TaxID=2144185 RepID=UPI00131F2B2F|nr:type II toxin-antitoxin system death-on-curing family toxin [Planctomonas deserti]